ncbi:MOSC domain-containing protein [Veronia pacifica]|uniref:MOSC domain-containing protein n=1 Tax=Veronia pacifica TaxID=1080227 RepID=A0A1C3E7X3_9GAMM|nr:MOSC domain-containing protein [Veronia pacifica]ODA29358.1 hypothetical protein A8L45_22275 [Veronia pacifica]
MTSEKHTHIPLLSVRLAVPSKLGDRQVPTGIVKEATAGPVAVTEMGLAGDFQADRRLHGGPDKAIYHFAAETYDTLKQALPHLTSRFSSPCVGENFSTLGMTDDSVYIGDIYRVGSAVLQVSQPRMPCWKLNQHVGNGHMMALLIQLNQTGWYYRVIEPGDVSAGDVFEQLDRVQDDFSVADIWQHWVHLREQKKQVASPISITGLSPQWRFDW